MSGYKPKLLEHEKVITPEEQEMLIDYISTPAKDFTRASVIIKTVLKTGLRASEICNLKVEHCKLDLNRPVLCVWGGKKRDKDQCDTVKIGKEFAEYLKHWIKLHNPKEYVFETRGHKLSRNTVWSDCKKIYNELGLSEKYGVHALRHRFITNSYKAFRDTMITMMQARHRNLAVTTRYIHLADEESEDFRKKLEMV